MGVFAMNGNELLLSMRQLACFYRDISVLLKTGEAALEKAGWQSMGNTAIANRSSSIGSPDYWAPYYLFRFFSSNRYKTLLAFVSVILDLPEEPRRITEPLVSAGWMDLGKEKMDSDAWEYSHATLHCWMPDRRDDGTFISVNPQKDWPDDGYDISFLSTLAQPLVAVSNSQSLEEKIIKPLLDEITKFTQKRETSQ
jgi:hypothetical protein